MSAEDSMLCIQVDGVETETYYGNVEIATSLCDLIMSGGVFSSGVQWVTAHDGIWYGQYSPWIDGTGVSKYDSMMLELPRDFVVWGNIEDGQFIATRYQFQYETGCPTFLNKTTDLRL